MEDARERTSDKLAQRGNSNNRMRYCVSSDARIDTGAARMDRDWIGIRNITGSSCAQTRLFCALAREIRSGLEMAYGVPCSVLRLISNRRRGPCYRLTPRNYLLNVQWLSGDPEKATEVIVKGLVACPRRKESIQVDGGGEYQVFLGYGQPSRLAGTALPLVCVWNERRRQPEIVGGVDVFLRRVVSRSRNHQSLRY